MALPPNNEWKEAKKNDWQFLFPVEAMGTVYRGKFLEALQRMITKGEVILPADTDRKQLFNILYKKNGWYMPKLLLAARRQ